MLSPSTCGSHLLSLPAAADGKLKLGSVFALCLYSAWHNGALSLAGADKCYSHSDNDTNRALSSLEELGALQMRDAAEVGSFIHYYYFINNLNGKAGGFRREFTGTIWTGSGEEAARACQSAGPLPR